MENLGYGGRQRTKFANKINISPSFLSDVFNCKSGPSFSLISGIAENFEDVNINWLLTGEGEPFLKSTCKTTDTPSEAHEPSNVIELEHVGLVRRFRDKVRAKDANLYLLTLERTDRDAFIEACGYLKGLAQRTIGYLDPDRRQVARRENDDPDRIPPAGDRRSGGDRRKAGG